MQVVFALQPLPKSIFLAGPTPRDPSVPSWRPEAIRILEELKFDGHVFVPEADDWASHDNYDGQIKWELRGLDRASVIVFWVPRDIKTMPAFTTNVEFGLYIKSGKVVVGWPKDTPKTGYLEHHAIKQGLPIHETLRETLEAAVLKA